MRGFALVLLVGLLSASTSGAFELLVPEPCALGESTSLPDDAHCAPTCVRCGCCARGVQITAEPVETRTLSTSRDFPVIAAFLPLADPQDIFHVPRLPA